jgi:hypothetical protein
VMSRIAGSFAPAAWEMVSMIVSSIEWIRLDSVTNFNERRVPDVAEYRSRASMRFVNSNGVSRHRWRRDAIRPSGDDVGYWRLLIVPRRY